MRVEAGLPVMDTEVDTGPIEYWRSKPGARKREVHIAQALDRHDGFVDVVLVSGQTGEEGGAGKVTECHEWNVERRRGRWRIQAFDPYSGHFKLGVVRP